MDRIYLDHAAATPLSREARDAMLPFLDGQYGNPGALHREGMDAKAAVDRARETIAELLAAHVDEIVFTGSGTESINLAIRGAISAWMAAGHSGRTPHLIVSEIEHPAVLETARDLERAGVRVSVLPITEDGVVSPSALSDAIEPDTVLISLQYANNEVGMIQPIREYARVIRKWKKGKYETDRSRPERAEERYPLFHTDACQAGTTLDLNVRTLGVDLLTINASKVYGPKGVGALFVRRGVPLSATTTGGDQEGGRRSGTENVVGIVGFAAALRDVRSRVALERERLFMLRDALEQACLAQVSDIVINKGDGERLPHISNITIPGADHEMLAIALDQAGIACSTKSACSEREGEDSHVLLALRRIGASALPARGLRFSLGQATTHEDVARTAEALGDCVKRFVEPVKGLVS